MSTAVPVPIQSVAPPPPVRRAWVSALKLTLKLLYAIAAGVFAVWVVSFTPSPGPELTQFVPARAGLVLHIRSGATLLSDAVENTALKELLDDEDFSRLFEQSIEKHEVANTETPASAKSDAITPIPQQIRHEYEMRMTHLPKFARGALKRMFPPRMESLYGVVGSEILVARIVPELDPEQVAANLKPVPQTLLITRVSGGAGLLTRMMSHFSRNANPRVFDLGGDAIAFGVNGAAPGSGRATPLETKLTASGLPNGEPLARLTIFPPILEGRRAEDVNYSETPLGPYLQALTESVFQSLLRAPSLSDMLGLTATPKEIRVAFYEKEGGIVAYGEIDGGVPGLPTNIPDPSTTQRVSLDNNSNSRPYLEGVLPVNPQACYLAYVVSQLRPSPEKEKPKEPANPNPDPLKPRGLTKSQRKCIAQIGYLQDHDVDLDTELFPAFGRAVHFRMDDSPPEFGPTGYGLLRMALSFDGKNERARYAAGELTHSGWDMYDGPAPKGAHTPYIRRFQSADHDCYVLATGEIFAPSWTVFPQNFSATSDAGSFALLRSGPTFLPPPATPPHASTSYFLKLDGRRVAPSVETYQSNEYSDLEKELGSQAFMEKYPNAELHAALIRKLCGFVGQFAIEVTPTGNGKGALKLEWSPGSVNVPTVKHEASSPAHGEKKENNPPPPAPQDSSAPVPAPPPSSDDNAAPAPPPPPDDK